MRRRGRQRAGFAGGFSVALLIVVLAVLTGYAGTRYIIYPYILNSTPVVAQKAGDGEDGGASGSGIVSGEQKIKDLTGSAVTTGQAVSGAATTAPVSGQAAAGTTGSAAAAGGQPTPPAETATLYSLQFGSFSSKESAQSISAQLLQMKITTYVMAKDGSFKVMGIPYKDKDTAKLAAGRLKPSWADVYVSTITVPFKDQNQKTSLMGLLDSYVAAEQLSDSNRDAVLFGMQGPIITMMEGLMQ